MSDGLDGNNTKETATAEFGKWRISEIRSDIR